MENSNNSTMATIICINSKENRFLYQDLKKCEVLSKIRDRNANGESNTNIFIII